MRFADVTLRVIRHGGQDPAESIVWDAPVGFFDQWEPPWAIVLGQRGFFDQFTVTMNRAAMTLAIEDKEIFDQRYEPFILPGE
ncbi:MAG TPA: hypothetical protein VNE62_03700 [Actinomycetota bacterium]|nr:hypothetical protein [Actinomycetota bacterium]